MAKLPTLHIKEYEYSGEKYVIISRGHLMSFKVRMDEIAALSDQLIDTLERQT